VEHGLFCGSEVPQAGGEERLWCSLAQSGLFMAHRLWAPCFGAEGDSGAGQLFLEFVVQ
jgi:hypothetical protein